jgi:hypothetical protein
VAITWDPAKLKANVEKHGVRFADAVVALEDPVAVHITDWESDPAEERFVVLGLDATARVLVVVYTWRGDDIRLISARCANPHERKEYENQ